MKSADRQGSENLEDKTYKSKLERLSKLTDEELVRLSKEGDGIASECIFERYKKPVRVKSRTYFLVGANSEDIVQEGMIGLYKAIRDYSPDKQASFKAFADICVTRQIITAIKAATRQKHMPLNSYISLNQPAFESESEKTYEETLPGNFALGPEDILIDRESYRDMTEKIKKCLSKLEMTVLRLYLQGKSYGEIADSLGKGVKSVDNALQRIKAKLERELWTQN